MAGTGREWGGRPPPAEVGSCLGRRGGGGGAEAADVEALDAAGEARLRLHHALHLHDGPLRAPRLAAPAPHADLHRPPARRLLLSAGRGWRRRRRRKRRRKRGEIFFFFLGDWRQNGVLSWSLPAISPPGKQYFFASRQNKKNRIS